MSSALVLLVYVSALREAWSTWALHAHAHTCAPHMQLLCDAIYCDYSFAISIFHSQKSQELNTHKSYQKYGMWLSTWLFITNNHQSLTVLMQAWLCNRNYPSHYPFTILTSLHEAPSAILSNQASWCASQTIYYYMFICDYRINCRTCFS